MKTRKIVQKSETFMKPHQKLLGESRLKHDTDCLSIQFRFTMINVEIWIKTYEL